jgi:hypothetical protein
MSLTPNSRRPLSSFNPVLGFLPASTQLPGPITRTG